VGHIETPWGAGVAMAWQDPHNPMGIPASSPAKDSFRNQNIMQGTF